MNKYFSQKYIAGILAMVMFFTLFAGLNPAKADTALKINADSAILVDGKTGQVLFEQNADSMLGIASMSKMMTEYILLNAIKQGKVKWDQEYSVSDVVYKISQNKTLSNVPLRKDGKYKVKELYDAMAIYSANGATIALAEILAGTEANFVKMMNDTANKLGLKDYKFVNATGLSNKDYNGMQPTGSADDENMMSARAVAKLAYDLINEFPEVLKTASTPTMMFRGGTTDQIKMDNWNWMLPSLVYGYQGMDGLKTGHTDLAGNCFTGTAMRDGKRYITVVQNAKEANGQSTYKARFDETRKMMDFAFSNYTKEDVLPKHSVIKGHETVPVIKGKDKQVKVYTKTSVNLDILNGDKNNYQPVLVLDKNKVDKNGALMAPIKKGDKVGYVTLVPKNGEKLSYLTGAEAQVDVIAAQDVEKANWFVLMMHGIGDFFGHVFHSIGSTVKGWF